MTAALAEVAAAIASHPSARELAAPPEAAPALFDLLATRARDEPAPRRHRGHGLRRRAQRCPRLERTALRHSSRSHRRAAGSLRDAVGARPAPGARPANRQQRAGRRRTPTPGPPVGEGRRVGAVAVEHVLSRAAAGAAIAQVEDSFPTSIAPVSLRPRSEGAGETPRPGAFLLRTPAGAPLLEGFVALTDVQQRARGLARDRDRLGDRDPRRDPAAPHRSAARRAQPGAGAAAAPSAPRSAASLLLLGGAARHLAGA